MLKFTIRFILIGLIIIGCDRAIAHVLKKGLVKYDQLEKHSEVLCIGSSYTEKGIDPRSLEFGLGVPVTKYVKFGTRTLQRLAMLHIYLSEQKKFPKIVVYDVDPALFEADIVGEHPYIRYYPFMDVPEVAEFIMLSGATKEEFLCRKIMHLLRFNDPPTIWKSIKGYRGTRDFVAGDSVRPDALNKIKNNAVEFNTQNQAQALEKVIDLVTKQNSKLVFVFIPQTNALNQSRKENVSSALNLLNTYASMNKNVIFLDYNNKYEHRLDMFADANHLNSLGQKIVTTDLIHDLKKVIDSI